MLEEAMVTPTAAVNVGWSGYVLLESRKLLFGVFRIHTMKAARPVCSAQWLFQGNEQESAYCKPFTTQILYC
jgi:hypothetical protein